MTRPALCTITTDNPDSPELRAFVDELRMIEQAIGRASVITLIDSDDVSAYPPFLQEAAAALLNSAMARASAV